VWIADDAGMPHTIVESFDWQGAGRLVAFTHGRSVFITDVVTPGSSGGAGRVNPNSVNRIPPAP